MIEFRSVIAETGEPMASRFRLTHPPMERPPCVAADAAFDICRAAAREAFPPSPERIAAENLDLDDYTIRTTTTGTVSPRARLEGRRGRTVRQVRLFAEFMRDGIMSGKRPYCAGVVRSSPHFTTDFFRGDR
ncbi:hypothetical protein GCM10011494_05660 [Novosphingobium endophyticum]|uniref:Uncharacterized protein n=1 Tax=Novosphingobium endophyticum TaxID=1955250 RepID=A0A916X480_9SPHN|nr:hypothetical protein [Novosphingobium endophyticum]GGB90195.1 hypothetical protein GCM10011494_05660 [Novosphingobium endophyticum]